ncbi:AraC family transcriptional regulator [Pseudochelatococcus sp. B33]
MALERPLARYARFTTTAVDEAREQVAKVYCDHHLDLLGDARRLDAWQNMVRLGSMSVGAMSYGADVDIAPGQLGDFYLLMLPHAGTADIQHGRQRAVATSRCGTLLNPDDLTRMRWSADCDKIMVRIDRQALEQQLSSMLGGVPVRGIAFDLATPLSGGMARWWRTVGLLIEDLDASPHARSSLAASLHESLLLVSLLEHQPSNYSDRLSARCAGIAPRHVRNVEAYIEANADKPLTIDDLVAVSGVSSRALFEGFRRFRGVSPLAHVRTVRMRMVRERLLNPRDNDTVTSVATDWGFHQLGRFAAQYRQMFGETPSQTLRRG